MQLVKPQAVARGPSLRNFTRVGVWAVLAAITGCHPALEPCPASPSPSVGAGVGVAVPGAAALIPVPATQPIAVGFQLYSFNERMKADIPGTLALVRSLGFTEVEIADLYGQPAAQWRQALGAAGLTATSLMVPYDRLSTDLPGVVADGRSLGVTWVGCAWIPHDDVAGLTAEEANRAVGDFNRWGAALHSQGLHFFFHPHSYEFRPRPGVPGTVFEDLLARTTPGEVEFEQDVFWFVRAGVDPVSYLRRFPGRFPLLHLKDIGRGVPLGDTTGHAPRESFVPIGAGTVDWSVLLQVAQSSGVQHYYIEDESGDPLAGVKASLGYFRRMSEGI